MITKSRNAVFAKTNACGRFFRPQQADNMSEHIGNAIFGVNKIAIFFTNCQRITARPGKNC